MAHQAPTDTPLKELKHDAVPGYLQAFAIAFMVMGVYLAIILITSPGSAKKDYHKSGKPAGEAKSGGAE